MGTPGPRRRRVLERDTILQDRMRGGRLGPRGFVLGGVRGLEPGHAASAERDHQQLVDGIEGLGELPPQLLHGRWVEPATEDGVLHALAGAFQDLGGAAEAGWVADVVADEPPSRVIHGDRPVRGR